jgi:quercetin dioxygenase-like cupin family protein
MKIERSGAQPSAPAPAGNFTGQVRQDMRFHAEAPGRVRGGFVTFEPGARTHWHSHPLGQTLVITAGLGWVQGGAGPVQEVRPGDVVSFAPGERHWHGATERTAMTHLAIGEVLDGRGADWFEPVSEAEYLAGRPAAGAPPTRP